MINVALGTRDLFPEKEKKQFGSNELIGFILLMTGMLAACGSAPVTRPPQVIEQALAADKDARRALRSGDLLRAKSDFAKALALQQSQDDAAGAATSLINLATVNHQLHDDQAALDAHRAAPHFKELGRKLGDYLAGRPEVNVMQEI